jgi:hypothetical protein
MKFNEITENASSGSTGAGSIATVASPMSTQSRNASIYGGKKAGNLLTGKKSKGKYANSVEARKQMKLKEANDKPFAKYNTKQANKMIRRYCQEKGIPIQKILLNDRTGQLARRNLTVIANRPPNYKFNQETQMYENPAFTQRDANEIQVMLDAPKVTITGGGNYLNIHGVMKGELNDDPLSEAEVLEQEVLVIPGTKRKDRKTGFVPHGESRVDHEVKMAKADLFATAKNAKEIMECLKNRSEEEGIKGWMQSYITLANDYLNSVNESLQYEMQMHEDQLAAYGNGADDRINTRNKLDKEPYGGPSSSYPGGQLQSTSGVG